MWVGEIFDLEQSTVHSATHWTSVYQSFIYSVYVLCQSLQSYLLFLMLLLLLLLLLLFTVLAFPSRSWRIVC